MLAGQLTKRITLSRIIRYQGELGEEKVITELVDEVWANAEAISNRKIRTADQQQVIETMRFTIRPRSDVDIDWIITYQHRDFTVSAVDRNIPDRLIIKAEADSRHDRK
ncbi:phage head closure protein [Arsenophonus nasoniae]|uniref:Phage head closure protein n=1 Tax=Arsenophonus nasoniae TaxID=638 RepID=A0AA95K844_9GAMM|nr:phage head closure protein [Arsenophonus nasoniae]WGL93770.1 phage head closure protein [Arsenophonus nasoniae]WGL96018.1 phage head closure protein [Arsenophonus nasoniae]